MIAFLVLLLLIVIVLGIDAVPQFNTWQSRIKIGRWTGRKQWSQAVRSKSLQWLKNTPAITLTDNRRLIVIDKLKGNYSRSSIQHWQQAALLLGIAEHCLANPDQEAQSRAESFIGSMTQAGSWKHAPKEVDSAILAYAMMQCRWLDQNRYKPAYDAVRKMIDELLGEDQTVAYRRHMKEFRYVDTVGFICPFLVRYGILFGDEAAIALAVKQIDEYTKHGMLGGTYIPCHTYHVTTGLPSGLFGWGRGMGWFAIGLIDSWMALPGDHPSKKQLEAHVIAFAKTALSLQNVAGGWGWNATNPKSITDSSATATLSWYLANAAGIPEIENECRAACDKALQYLMKVTRRDGAIDFSQGDTKDIAVYSQVFDILPFTQGFALRCASRLKQD